MGNYKSQFIGENTAYDNYKRYPDLYGMPDHSRYSIVHALVMLKINAIKYSQFLASIFVELKIKQTISK